MIPSNYQTLLNKTIARRTPTAAMPTQGATSSLSAGFPTTSSTYSGSPTMSMQAPMSGLPTAQTGGSSPTMSMTAPGFTGTSTGSGGSYSFPGVPSSSGSTGGGTSAGISAPRTGTGTGTTGGTGNYFPGVPSSSVGGGGTGSAGTLPSTTLPGATGGSQTGTGTGGSNYFPGVPSSSVGATGGSTGTGTGTGGQNYFPGVQTGSGGTTNPFLQPGRPKPGSPGYDEWLRNSYPNEDLSRLVGGYQPGGQYVGDTGNTGFQGTSTGSGASYPTNQYGQTGPEQTVGAPPTGGIAGVPSWQLQQHEANKARIMAEQAQPGGLANPYPGGTSTGGDMTTAAQQQYGSFINAFNSAQPQAFAPPTTGAGAANLGTTNWMPQQETGAYGQDYFKPTGGPEGTFQTATGSQPPAERMFQGTLDEFLNMARGPINPATGYGVGSEADLMAQQGYRQGASGEWYDPQGRAIGFASGATGGTNPSMSIAAPGGTSSQGYLPPPGSPATSQMGPTGFQGIRGGDTSQPNTQPSPQVGAGQQTNTGAPTQNPDGSYSWPISINDPQNPMGNNLQAMLYYMYSMGQQGLDPMRTTGGDSGGSSGGTNTGGADIGSLLSQMYQAAWDDNRARDEMIRQGYGAKINDLYSWQGDSANNILSGYDERYKRNMDTAATLGAQELKDIQDRYTGERGNAFQSLMSRGLGNTTVTDAVNRGLVRGESDALGSALDRINRLKLQTDIGLSGDYLGATERLHGERLGLMQNEPQLFLDYLERISNQYPDMGRYLDLALAAGQGTGGMVGSGYAPTINYYIPGQAYGIPGGGTTNYNPNPNVQYGDWVVEGPQNGQPNVVNQPGGTQNTPSYSNGGVSMPGGGSPTYQGPTSGGVPYAPQPGPVYEPPTSGSGNYTTQYGGSLPSNIYQNQGPYSGPTSGGVDLTDIDRANAGLSPEQKAGGETDAGFSNKPELKATEAKPEQSPDANAPMSRDEWWDSIKHLFEGTPVADWQINDAYDEALQLGMVGPSPNAQAAAEAQGSQQQTAQAPGTEQPQDSFPGLPSNQGGGATAPPQQAPGTEQPPAAKTWADPEVAKQLEQLSPGAQIWAKNNISPDEGLSPYDMQAAYKDYQSAVAYINKGGAETIQATSRMSEREKVDWYRNMKQRFPALFAENA